MLLANRELECIEKIESVEVHVLTNRGKKTLCFTVREQDQHHVSMKMESETEYSELFRFKETKVIFQGKTTIEFPSTEMTIKT